MSTHDPLDLWKSQARVVVEKSLQEAHKAHNDEMRRKWRMLRDFLDGVHQAHTQAYAQVAYTKRSAEWRRGNGHAFRYYRLTQLLRERTSLMFHRPPKLLLAVNGKPLEKTDPKYGDQVRQWEDDQEAAELDTTLDHLDGGVRIMRQQVVQPTWIADGDHSRIEWVGYDPQETFIHQSESDPGNLSVARSVSIAMRQAEDTVGGLGELLYSTWTREVVGSKTVYRHWIHTKDNELADNQLFQNGVNAYGVLPFVLWQLGKPGPGEIFIPPDEALIQAQLGINIGLTDLAHGMKYYAHPQWVLKGNMQGRATPVFGPGELAEIASDAELKAETPATNLMEVRSTLEWFLRMEAVSRNLPADILSPSAARNLAALQEQRHDLTIDRERARPYYERAIRKTFRVHKVVSNTARDIWGVRRVEYSPEVQLLVQIAPLPKVQDPWQSAQTFQVLASKGVAGSVQYLMDTEGIDREEAMRRVLQNLEDEAMVAERAQPGAPPTPAKAPGDQPRPASVERG